MKLFGGGWYSRSRVLNLRVTVCTCDDESNARLSNDSRIGTLFDETTYALDVPLSSELGVETSVGWLANLSRSTTCTPEDAAGIRAATAPVVFDSTGPNARRTSSIRYSSLSGGISSQR